MSSREQKAYSFFLVTGMLFVAIFACWWVQPSHVTHRFTGSSHIIDILAFIILSFVVWQRIFMDVISWLIGRKIIDPKYLKPQPGKKVAFITNFVPGKEPLEMLRDTLIGMKKVNYPHDSWVLDEGNDPGARLLAEELDINYFTRKGITKYNTKAGTFKAKTKGGNHNAWYDAHGHTYDFVAQVDTDFVPKKNFLTATIGQFRDPKVAFVGTPQIYGNTDDSWIARGAAQQTFVFYGAVMRGLATRNTTMMIGANHVVRVKALKDIGFYRAHITEDLLTGMTLHHAGWKSVYIPKVLAIGEGPNNWKAYFNQQTRWAFGCIDVFFRHFPSLTRDMTSQRMFYYLMLQQFYFNGLAFVIGLLLLVIYFTSGYPAADIPLLALITWGLPLYLWRQIFTLWRSRFNIRPEEERGLMTAGRFITIAVLPIYFIALLSAMSGSKLTFKVTPKGSKQQRVASSSVFIPHFLLGLIALAGLAAGVILGHTAVIFIAWGIINAISMLPLYIYYRAREIVHGVKRLFTRKHRMIDAEPVAIN